jgi:hypothetical protein
MNAMAYETEVEMNLFRTHICEISYDLDLVASGLIALHESLHCIAFGDHCICSATGGGVTGGGHKLSLWYEAGIMARLILVTGVTMNAEVISRQLFVMV